MTQERRSRRGIALCWAAVVALIVTVGCDFYDLREVEIRISAGQDGMVRAHDEVEHILQASGYDEWKGPVGPGLSKSGTTIFNASGEQSVTIYLRDDEAGQCVVLTYRQTLVRRFRGDGQARGFSKDAETALQDLISGFQRSFGESNVSLLRAAKN